LFLRNIFTIFFAGKNTKERVFYDLAAILVVFNRSGCKRQTEERNLPKRKKTRENIRHVQKGQKSGKNLPRQADFCIKSA
jgi:hypothetical protein